MSKIKEHNKVKDDKERKKYICIGSVIVLIVSIIVIFFSEPTYMVSKFRNLPEAQKPQTGYNMKIVDYLPRKVANSKTFKFSRANVLKLKRDLRGFLIDNIKDFNNGYFRVLTTYKMLSCIQNDVPGQSEKAKEYIKKLDSLYGPAILQYLYTMDEFDSLDNYLPDVFFEKNITTHKNNFEDRNINQLNNYTAIKPLFELCSSLNSKLHSTYNNIFFLKDYLNSSIVFPISEVLAEYINSAFEKESVKASNRVKNFKERYPFLYNEKYTDINALKILKEADIMTNKNSISNELIHLLLLHPKALSCDTQFILSNLCYEKTTTLYASGNIFNWSFVLPRYWDVVVPSHDKNSEIVFYTKLDGITGGVGHYDKLQGVKIDSEESEVNYLKTMVDKMDILKSYIKIDNITSNRSNIVKIGNKNVLLFEYTGYKNDRSYLNGRIYLFLSKYSIFAYMFNVEGTTAVDSLQRMVRNTPLFDSLINATKLTY